MSSSTRHIFVNVYCGRWLALDNSVVWTYVVVHLYRISFTAVCNNYGSTGKQFILGDSVCPHTCVLLCCGGLGECTCFCNAPYIDKCLSDSKFAIDLEFLRGPFADS